MGANLAHTTGEFERIAHEIDINIFGIGISLVNNTLLESNHEILYMSITSSGLFTYQKTWEIELFGGDGESFEFLSDKRVLIFGCAVRAGTFPII